MGDTKPDASMVEWTTPNPYLDESDLELFTNFECCEEK